MDSNNLIISSENNIEFQGMGESKFGTELPLKGFLLLLELVDSFVFDFTIGYYIYIIFPLFKEIQYNFYLVSD